jgi:hypothetical protein
MSPARHPIRALCCYNRAQGEEMSRRYFILTYWLLMALVYLGIWLGGIFKSNTDDLSTLRVASGYFLIMAASIGLIVLIYRNIRPMGQRGIVAWEITRKRGKRTYILNAILKGFLLGVMGSLISIAGNFWHSSSISESLSIAAGITVVIIIGMCYAAIRTWDANEKDYKALALTEAQHNNSLNRTRN